MLQVGATCYLNTEVGRFPQFEPLAFDPLVERLAVNELAYDVDRLAFAADCVNRDNA